MATAQNQELFPDFHNPEGLRVINDRCLVRTQGGHRVVIVSGIILAQYAITDRMAEAHAMISLVEQGWADQNDVARVFGYGARTVRRQQRRFDEGGLAALGRKGGYARSPALPVWSGNNRTCNRSNHRRHGGQSFGCLS